MNTPQVLDMEPQDQAERWYVRMQEPDCSDAERDTCRQWRDRNPAHEAAYQEVEDIWKRSPALAADPAMAEALRLAEHAPATSTARRRRWLAPTALAASLAAVAVTAALYWYPPAPDVQRHQTALGEQQTLTLPDGTQVVLDTRTSVVTRYSPKRRVVELETGQALFRVQPDASRPFVVHAGGGTVTAVGTAFQVRAETAATVTLLEGKIRVAWPGGDAQPLQTTTLAPGQQLRYQRDGQWSSTHVDPATASAWTSGNLFVRGWQLDDLVEEMNRYSTIQVRLGDPTLAELRISGAFRTGDVTALVLVLEHGWQVRATESDGEVILTR